MRFEEPSEDFLTVDDGMPKRLCVMAVFGGAIGVWTTASRLDWTPAGDSSRSRREESLLDGGVALDRLCRWSSKSVYSIEQSSSLLQCCLLTGVPWMRDDLRRGVAMTGRGINSAVYKQLQFEPLHEQGFGVY